MSRMKIDYEACKSRPFPGRRRSPDRNSQTAWNAPHYGLPGRSENRRLQGRVVIYTRLITRSINHYGLLVFALLFRLRAKPALCYFWQPGRRRETMRTVPLPDVKINWRYGQFIDNGYWISNLLAHWEVVHSLCTAGWTVKTWELNPWRKDF